MPSRNQREGTYIPSCTSGRHGTCPSASVATISSPASRKMVRTESAFSWIPPNARGLLRKLIYSRTGIAVQRLTVDLLTWPQYLGVGSSLPMSQRGNFGLPVVGNHVGATDHRFLRPILRRASLW